MKTSRGNVARLLVVPELRKDEGGGPPIPVFVVERFDTFDAADLSARLAGGRALMLFPGFRLDLDTGQVVPDGQGGDLAFTKDGEPALVPLRGSSLFALAKAPAPDPTKPPQPTPGRAVVPGDFAGRYRLHANGQWSGTLDLKVEEKGDVSGQFRSDAHGASYPVTGQVASGAPNKVTLAMKFPRSQGDFEGYLWTEGKGAMAGTFRLLDKTYGFFAIRDGMPVKSRGRACPQRPAIDRGCRGRDNGPSVVASARGVRVRLVPALVFKTSGGSGDRLPVGSIPMRSRHPAGRSGGYEAPPLRRTPMLLAFDDVGPGPVVVLLHGFPLDRSMWEFQLAEIGSVYRVIAPDLRGSGSTAAPDGIYTVDLMADDVIDTLDALELDDPVVIGGLSMGGYVALSLALRYPERLRGLMLMNTRATADAPATAKVREDLARSSRRPASPTRSSTRCSPSSSRRRPMRIIPSWSIASATAPCGRTRAAWPTRSAAWPSGPTGPRSWAGSASRPSSWPAPTTR